MMNYQVYYGNLQITDKRSLIHLFYELKFMIKLFIEHIDYSSRRICQKFFLDDLSTYMDMFVDIVEVLENCFDCQISHRK